MTVLGSLTVILAFLVGTAAIVFVCSLARQRSLRPVALREAAASGLSAGLAFVASGCIALGILYVIYLVEVR